MEEDEEIPSSKVYRSLSAKVFRIRFHFIRLSDSDLFLCLMSSGLTMFLINITGTGKVLIFNTFKLDPTGWLAIAVVSVLLFSLFNRLRPDGNVKQILLNLSAASFLAARTPSGDRRWFPANRGRLYRGDRRRRLVNGR